MSKYERKDKFYQRAKAEGHASRAFYKLEEVQKKYGIIKKGDRVLDLGCAPGGWLQLVSKIVGNSGSVFGIDILPVKIGRLPNVGVVQLDIEDSNIIGSIYENFGSADVVLSDMAPSTSGIKFRDYYLSYELAVRALDVAKKVLKVGGNFVVKLFPGEEFANYKKELEKNFDRVGQYRPPATRKTSIEVYLVGIGFQG